MRPVTLQSGQKALQRHMTSHRGTLVVPESKKSFPKTILGSAKRTQEPSEESPMAKAEAISK